MTSILITFKTLKGEQQEHQETYRIRKIEKCMSHYNRTGTKYWNQPLTLELCLKQLEKENSYKLVSHNPKLTEMNSGTKSLQTWQTSSSQG